MKILMILKSKWFSRFARQNRINDKELCAAIVRAEQGLIDADLGGKVIKQRIARKNEGKSGGFRTIILFQIEDKSFFVYGFPKSQQDNLSQQELKGFKKLANDVAMLSEEELQKLIKEKEFIEVKCHDENI
jgi:hypothetical protein